MTWYKVYILFMKETSELLYIGQTKDNPECRLDQHLSPRGYVRVYLESKGYKRREMRDLIELVEVFFTQNYAEALAQEKRLIRQHHPTINTHHNSPSPPPSLSNSDPSSSAFTAEEPISSR